MPKQPSPTRSWQEVRDEVACIQADHGPQPTTYLIQELASLAGLLPETNTGRDEALGRASIQAALNQAASRVAETEHALRQERARTLYQRALSSLANLNDRRIA